MTAPFSQQTQIKQNSIRVPKLNGLEYYSVYDDFSNGDGNFTGTDLLGNTRLTNKPTEIVISDGILTTTNSGNAKGLSYNLDFNYPLLLNVKFSKSSSNLFWFGILDTASAIYLPEDGLLINTTSYSKRVSDSNTALGISVTNDTVTSLVIHCTSGNMDCYIKNSIAPYTLLASFSAQAFPSTFDIGYYFGSSYVINIYRIAAVQKAFQSINQLEVLFPL